MTFKDVEAKEARLVVRRILTDAEIGHAKMSLEIAQQKLEKAQRRVKKAEKKLEQTKEDAMDAYKEWHDYHHSGVM